MRQPQTPAPHALVKSQSVTAKPHRGAESFYDEAYNMVTTPGVTPPAKQDSNATPHSSKSSK